MSTHVPQLDVPSDPQELAQAVGAVMYAGDAASQGLEMKVEEMAPGYARLTMRVRPDMLNGHKTAMAASSSPWPTAHSRFPAIRATSARWRRAAPSISWRPVSRATC